jgi:hypothetical protein
MALPPRTGLDVQQTWSTFKIWMQAIWDHIAILPAATIARGAWATGQNYALSDYVVQAGATYVCQVAHTSGAVFATDLAAGKWLLSSGVTGADLAAQNGAARIGVMQAGIGAVARTLENKNFESISILDFMTDAQKADAIAGTKTLDLTAPIQAAVNRICLIGGTLNAGWRVRVDSPIVGLCADSTLTVRINGTGGEIDFSNLVGGGGAAGSVTAFQIGGSVSTTSSLNANVLAGVMALDTVAPLGVVAGDIVQITSTDLFNPTRAYYYKGELCRVASVAGNTINVDTPLYDGYAAATTTVKKLIAPRIIVEGLRTIGNSNQVGVIVKYARDVEFSSNRTTGFRYACGYLWYCYNAAAWGNTARDFWYAGTGTSYGLGITSSQHVAVFANSIHGGRHAITGGGNEPCRDVTVYGNSVSNVVGVEQAIDAHGNCQYWRIEANQTTGIVGNGAIDLDVLNNTIIVNDTTQLESILLYQEIDAAYYNVRGNTIKALGANTRGVVLNTERSLVGSPVSLSLGRLNISSNSIDAVTSCILLAPRNAGSTNCTIKKLVLANNIAVSHVGQPLSINFAGVADLLINSIDIEGGTYEAEAQAAIAMAVNAPASYPRVWATGTKLLAQRPASYHSVLAGTDVRLQGCYVNGASAGGAASRSMRFINTGVTEVLDCVVENFALANGIELDAGGPATYYERGTRFKTTASKVPLNTAAAQVISHIGNGERKVFWAAAIPTTGTWAVGDQAVVLTPVVGQPKAWRCTVAGTPGTWISEGNL